MAQVQYRFSFVYLNGLSVDTVLLFHVPHPFSSLSSKQKSEQIIDSPPHRPPSTSFQTPPLSSYSLSQTHHSQRLHRGDLQTRTRGLYSPMLDLLLVGHLLVLLTMSCAIGKRGRSVRERRGRERTRGERRMRRGVVRSKGMG